MHSCEHLASRQYSCADSSHCRKNCQKATVVHGGSRGGQVHIVRSKANLLEAEEAHDLCCDLLRTEPRPVLPLDQEAQVTRPGAEFFHLRRFSIAIRQLQTRLTLRRIPKVLSSSYVRPISDSDSSSCSPAERGKSSAEGRASRNS